MDGGPAGRERSRLPGRVLLCSPELPPFQSGHATVLERFLRDVDPRDVCMVAFDGRAAPDEASGPDGKRYRIRTGWRPGTWEIPGWLRPVRSARKLSLEVVRRAGILADLIRTERCGALVVTSSSSPDPAAAQLAASRSGVPLVVCMFDDWRHLLHAHDAWAGRMATALEALLLARADHVITLNPLLASTLQRTFGRRPEVIPIPLPEHLVAGPLPGATTWPRSSDGIRILFTGQVYDAHVDAIRRVLEALEDPALTDVTLHIYSSTPPSYLDQVGIRGRYVLHPHLPAPAIHQAQRDADILLLPLAFESRYPEIIRTAAPTKLGEYLASGTPVLMHAPGDSFPALLARGRGVAALVDRPETGLLVQELRRLVHDDEYRSGIVAAAQAFAHRTYAPSRTTARFAALLRACLEDGGRSGAQVTR